MVKNFKVLLFLLFLSFLIRIVYAAFSHDFWMDEVYNYFVSENQPGQIILTEAHDNSPPLHFLFMHYWQKVSHNFIWIRLSSVIFGVLTLFVVYLIAKDIFNAKTALSVLVLASVSPSLIYFSSENRPYALFALLGATTILTYMNLHKKANLLNLFLFVFSGTLALYTHYYMLLLLLALPPASFISSFFKIKLKFLVTAYFWIVILFLPWLLLILFKERLGCICFHPTLGIESTFAFLSIGGHGIVSLKRFFEPQSPLLLRIFLGFVILLANFTFFFSIRYFRIPKIRWLLSLFFISLLIIAAISFVKPLMSLRSFIYLVPIFLMLSAYVINNSFNFKTSRIILFTYILLSLAVTLTTSQKLFFNQEPLSQLSSELKNINNKDSQIIHANLYTYLSSKYYSNNEAGYVLEQNLPKQIYIALKPQIISTVDSSKNTILVYAVDRIENSKFNKLTDILKKTRGQPKIIDLSNIKILIFPKQNLPSPNIII